MFQPRNEEEEEKEVTEWRLKRFLKMQNRNYARPKFRKPAERPMEGGSEYSYFLFLLRIYFL